MSDGLARLPGLTTEQLGQRHEHHDSIDSTNSRAAQWATDGAPHGALVTADAQTAGRGRRGRTWYSPAGDSIYASVVLRPPRPGPDLGPLALVVGLGLLDGLAQCGLSTARLKWPNDVMVGDRKLAGILCEARWSGHTVEVVAGFGINVNTERFEPPLHEVATSLRLQDCAGAGRAGVLTAVLGALEGPLGVFFEHGFAPLAPRYRVACATLGRSVHLGDVDAGGQGGRCTAQRVDDGGSLWVTNAAGRSFKVVSDDVTLSR